ncbi:MAG: GntR family transcriptional regulator [Chloroflexota bacterium]
MTSLFRSKKEVVYDLLREDIIRGKYTPGSRLIIDELALTLGVSQIPIREAMRQLEADGFVTIEPYVGATVTDLNADFIFEVFALLEHLEIISSRAACRVMSDDDLGQLADMIEQMDASVKNPNKWTSENKAMHLFICQCANTTLVLKMMEMVLDHWDRLRLHYLNDVFGNRIQAAQEDHRRILAAFYSRDPDEVERVIHAHNQVALSSYIRHLQSSGQIRNKDGFR